jgi:hypothetical protein
MLESVDCMHWGGKLSCFLAYEVHRSSSWSNYCAWSNIHRVNTNVSLGRTIYIERSHLFSRLASGDDPAWTTLLMAMTIYHGVLSCRRHIPSCSTWPSNSKNQKKKECVFPKPQEACHKDTERVSVCCKFGFPLFEVQVVSRTTNPSQESWPHVWFYTTWSSGVRGTWIWNSTSTILAAVSNLRGTLTRSELSLRLTTDLFEVHSFDLRSFLICLIIWIDIMYFGLVLYCQNYIWFEHSL